MARTSAQGGGGAIEYYQTTPALTGNTWNGTPTYIVSFDGTWTNGTVLDSNSCAHIVATGGDFLYGGGVNRCMPAPFANGIPELYPYIDPADSNKLKIFSNGAIAGVAGIGWVEYTRT